MGNSNLKKIRFLFVLVLLMLLFRYPVSMLNEYNSIHLHLIEDLIGLDADVVYFGDSVPNRFAICDEDVAPSTQAATVPQMVTDSTGLKVFDATIVSIKMLEFLEYNKVLLRYGRARYVILPVRRDSFDTAHVPLDAVVRGNGASFISFYEPFRWPGFNDMLALEFSPLTSSEVREGGRNVRFRDMELMQNSCEDDIRDDVKQIMMPMIRKSVDGLSKNVDVTPLKWSVDMLESKGIVPIVYISPVDTQFIKEHLGEESFLKLRGQLELMRRVLNDAGISYIDLSESLSGEYFIDRWCFNCGHLTYAGKEYVAKSIVDYINRQDRNIGSNKGNPSAAAR